MYPVIETVLLGVIANGLTALIALLGGRGRRILIEEKLAQNKTALELILQRAAHEVAEDIQWEGPARIEEVCLFLTSPEVEAIVRQIYSAKLAEGNGQRSLGLIRQEFLTSFSLYIELEEDRLVDSARVVLDALIEGCEHTLSMAIDEGILSAHEAKSASRHRLVLDELAAIQKNLALFTAQQKPDIQAILAFEEKYRQQIGTRHGYIIPPHFDEARKLLIDELYVCPHFVRTPKEKREGLEVLKMEEFLLGIYRAVLLGNPGCGKSTFASKLCYDLSTRYSERLFAGRQATPILVVLRDYGAEKRARNCSIVQFIEAMANSRYQVPAPPGAFEYLLLNGRAVVMFDGLDELLDTSYRQEISSDVESFCTFYPSVPVLVTSREVGYEQSPLDEKRFEIFRLAPFDDNQVGEYVTNWFAAELDLTPEQQKQKAGAFLDESKIVPDLRSNPLMLALMCNIYRGENYIPRNRPDVYEKCAVMLFERWDKIRGIHVLLPIEAHISPAMKYLAHWIYGDEKLQGGVTEEALIGKATEYLCPKRFEDRDEAEAAAREFIHFCNGRAWVFTDTGTTNVGEKLYQFTHRTFLEYFTAAHMVRTHPTPENLKQVLLPRIARREWDVVAQLAFQLQNKNVEGAGDELLTELIKQARQTESVEGWNLLSFAARCLEFMVPSPRVTRDITTACTERSLAMGVELMKRGKAAETALRHRGESAQLVADVLYAASENRGTVADSLEKLLVERVNNGIEQESVLALEIGLNLTLALHFRSLRSEVPPQREVTDFWASASDRIFNTCSARIEELCPKHFETCFEPFLRGKLSIRDLVGWHGIECLFRPSTYSMFPQTLFVSPAELLIHIVLSAPFMSEWKTRLESLLPRLREAGHILLASPPPWIVAWRWSRPMYMNWSLREDRLERIKGEATREPPSLDPDAVFGVFALMAALLEAGDAAKDKPSTPDEPIETIQTSPNPFFDRLRYTFLARFGHAGPEEVQGEMEQCGFTAEQQSFALRWVRDEVDLVGPAVRRSAAARKTGGKKG